MPHRSLSSPDEQIDEFSLLGGLDGENVDEREELTLFKISWA